MTNKACTRDFEIEALQKYIKSLGTMGYTTKDLAIALGELGEVMTQNNPFKPGDFVIVSCPSRLYNSIKTMVLGISESYCILADPIPWREPPSGEYAYKIEHWYLREDVEYYDLLRKLEEDEYKEE